MRIIIFVICSFVALCVFSQKDTLIVTDYTRVLVTTDSNGKLYPVTSLEESTKAGFFLNELLEGQFRICSNEELLTWVNGRLINISIGCNYYDPAEFFETAKSDTLFISFSSESSLSTLKCDLVIFEELLVIKDQVFLARDTRNSFEEFTILSLIIIVFFFGIIVTAFPSRISYLIEKSFTLKASSYEFVNTTFFSGASMNILALYCLILSFVGVYLDYLLSFGLFKVPESLMEFVLGWLRLALGIFSLFVIKWIVVSVIAGLFKFRDLKNYQLFDFLNFNLMLLLPAFLFLIADFVTNDNSNTWISANFMMLFPFILILFVIWFTLKFVNNSARKKLSIISYLCATEIIPVIILLGWFFK